MSSVPPLQVFISHAGSDSEAVKPLARLLENAGLDVWLDVERLKPGDLWMNELERALDRSRAVVLYIGQSGVRNWVDREVRVALDRAVKDTSFRLIPVLGPGADPDSLPPFLKQHQYIDCRTNLLPVDQIKAAIEGIGSREGPVSLLEPGQSPFRGLMSFGANDSLLFYGRDKEVVDLVNRTGATAFLAVVGDSGSGKSSLIKAGLIPALNRGRLAAGGGWIGSWRVAIFRPGDDPFREMAEALPQLKPEMGPGDAAGLMAEAKKQFAAGSDGLRNCIAALGLGAAGSQGSHQLLLVDQFEEIFTLCPDKDTRLRYIDTLLAAAPEETGNPVHIVITIRADFYSQCWQHSELVRRINENQYAVPRMESAGLRAAIEKPLALAGARAEPGLIDAILNDAGDEPGSLPLIEHALQQLWDRRKGDVLTNAAYEDLGRLQGALRNHADTVYASLGDAERQELARKILLRLTQLGEGSQDTRRRARKSELLELGGRNPETRAKEQAVLNQMVSARLLTAHGSKEAQTEGNQSDSDEFVEVAHEALIREWPALRGWVNESREALRIERRILQAATEWASFGKDPESLWQGARLAQAEEWSKEHGADLPENGCMFLEASLRARDETAEREEAHRKAELETAQRLVEIAHEQVKTETEAKQAAIRSTIRIRSLAAALSLLVVAAAAIAWWALGQQRSSESRQLAAESRQILDTDSAEALRLAILAGRKTYTEQAETSLWKAMENPLPHLILHHQGVVGTASFSPDGKRVVTASDDRTARIWDAETGQLLYTLVGHGAEVRSAAFSQDGKRIVTASDDKTAQIWDADSGQMLFTLAGHEDKVKSAGFSADGQQVVTASDDATARVWDAGSGRQQMILKGHTGPVLWAFFAPDGKSVVTGSSDKTARVWDAGTGTVRVTLVHNGAVSCAAFSPDGTRILTASGDFTARLWDAESGRPIFTFAGHNGTVYQAAFSSDGKRIATASADSTARIWDAETGASLFSLVHNGPVLSVRFEAHGKSILTASADNTARVFETSTGQPMFVLTGHKSPVLMATLSPDGSRYVTASADGTARVWSVQTGQARIVLSGHSAVSPSAMVSPDGKRIVTGSGNMARIWDIESGKALVTMEGHSAAVSSCAFAPDGTRIVTASADKTARVWDASSGQTLLTLTGHSDGVRTAVFSPDGTRIATVSDDGTARLWNAENGQQIFNLTGDSRPLGAAIFSPDGKRLVIANAATVARVWNTETGQMSFSLDGAGLVSPRAFSPDNKRIASVYRDSTALLWSAETGQGQTTLTGHGDLVWSASFSPDGKRIVTGSQDNTARVWDPSSGKLLETLSGHTASVKSAAFSPDGKEVVTASDDWTARLWDANTGHSRFALTGHINILSGAAFSPDGKRVVTASDDGTIRIYELDYDKMLTWAETQLPKHSGQ